MSRRTEPGTSPAAEAVVVVDHVSRSFRIRNAEAQNDTFVAVDDVSLSLRQCGSLGIVGESGSGKTTLARMIVGLDHPTSGSILLDGLPIRPGRRTRTDRLALSSRVQMVYQDPYSSLDPRQRVGVGIDQILRFRFELSKAERRSRTTELLEAVGLNQSTATAQPGELSGGQRQRVAIARALACEPKLLVLDEAVSALDVSVQGQVLNLLSDLQDEFDLAYLLISHDLAVVRQLCEEIVVMRNGSLIESGSTADVLDEPQDDYTKRLIGAVPRAGWTPRRWGATSQT